MILVFENCDQLHGRRVSRQAFDSETAGDGLALIDDSFLTSTPERWIPQVPGLYSLSYQAKAPP